MKQTQNLPLSIHRPKIPLPIYGSMARPLNPPNPTPENPLIISASELKDFLRCRVRWFWRHQARIVQKQKATPLIFGGIVHEILDPYYALPVRSIKRMAKIAKARTMRISPDELSIEDVELIQAMCVGYATWAKPRDNEIDLQKIQTEMAFDLPLDAKGRIRVRGFIDVAFVVGSLRRTMGMFEHKTKAQFRGDMLELNLQVSVYLWALRKLFPKKRRYIAYRNSLRKQMPGPRVKADLFLREPVERSDEEIDQWALDTERIALDMLDPAIYPNPMDACSWDCDYQMPCLMRGRPDDLEFILTRDYVAKPNRG